MIRDGEIWPICICVGHQVAGFHFSCFFLSSSTFQIHLFPENYVLGKIVAS